MARALERPATGWRRFDPFERAFRIMTSVRFAIAITLVVAAAATLGVIFPQMPAFARNDAVQRAIWLDDRAARYGDFRDLMDNLQLFEVFQSWWFNGLLALLLVSVCVCTANRFPPIWRSIVRGPKRVNDQYFQIAHHRADFTTPRDVSALGRVLRRKGYKVTVTEEGPTTYLYADRFPWAKLATFASHLSLLIFMAGGLVTWRVGASEDVAIPEGQTRPVFDVDSSRHMQVRLEEFVHVVDAEGRSRAFESHLVVYKDGEEVARGSATVNDPLSWGGYKFHQAGFIDQAAGLEVRDLENDRLVYSEVMNLPDELPLPRVTVRDESGNVLFDDVVVQTTVFPDEEAYLGALNLPGREGAFAVGVLLDRAQAESGANPWSLVVSGPQTAETVRVPFGAEAPIEGLTFSFASLGSSLATVNTAIPSPDGNETLVQMAERADGSLVLSLGSPDGELARLAPGESAVVAGNEYTFLGQRDFSGITVRKDPGSLFIWTATGLLVGGLAVTFYVPRRRLWAKITPERTYLAGIADRGARFTRELRAIGRDAGSPDAWQPETEAVREDEDRE
jgi:cytochrome c biogenesis protein ResB